MPESPKPVRFAWPGCLLLSIAVSGCSMRALTADGTELDIRSPAFSAYVERVFREQNRVAGDLGFALLDAELEGDFDAVARMEAAESRLLDACEGLNELAATHRDGERMPRLRALSAARTAPDCEAETAAARERLDDR